MLGAIISPLPLNVQPEDLTLVGEVVKGKDQGSIIYLNTRWIKENHKTLFDGEDYESSLLLMQNELKICDNVKESVMCWVDELAITTLGMEEVPEFNELYKLTKNPELLGVLTEEEYEEGASVAEVLILNGLDLLINLGRRSVGGSN